MRKILIILSLLLITGKIYGETIVRSDDIKAAFIFHFITFTQWDDDKANYYVCIPNDEGLKNVVQESLEDKVINNRSIVVMDKVFDGCHVIVADYAPASDTTLTIGRLERGAMLEFRVVNNKLKFAANPQKIKKSKLKVSSQLLKLAILEQKGES